MRVLLACLAYHAPTPIRREEIMEQLWPEIDIESQRNRLSLSLTALRKLLDPANTGSILTANRTTIALRLENFQSDIFDFDRHIATAAKSLSETEKIRHLELACSCYSGPLLEDTDLEWVYGARAERLKQYTEVSLQLADQLMKTGTYDRVIATLRKAQIHDPLNDAIHIALLKALVQAGRHAEAVRHYRDLERSYMDELGIRPSPELQTIVATLSVVTASPIAGPTPAQSPSLANVDASEPRTDGSPIPLRKVMFPIQVKFMAAAAVALAAGLMIWRPTKGRSDLPAGKLISAFHYNPESDEKDSEPASLVTAPDGSIYITGFVQTTKNDVDFLTLKLSGDGKLLWKRRLNGIGNDCDRSYSLALDTSGNCIVAGESYNGDRKNGGTEWDMTVAKYDTHGRELWRRYYDSPGHADERAIKAVVDAAGDIYVGGWTKDTAESSRYILVKYASGGERLWTRIMEPSSHPGSPVDSHLHDMAIDTNGNVCLASEARIAGLPGEKGRFAFLTVSYDKRGNLLWSRIFGGDSISEAHARKVTVGADGMLYVGGFANSSRDNALRSVKNLVVVKYDQFGHEQTVVGREDRLYRIDRATERTSGLAVSGSGQIAITGHKEDNRFVAASFGRQGELAWEYRFNNPSDSLSTFCQDIAFDHSGNACFTSFFKSKPENSSCAVTIKQSPQGRNLWCSYYNADVPGQTIGMAVAVDPGQNVIVAGRCPGKRSNNLMILKYSP